MIYSIEVALNVKSNKILEQLHKFIQKSSKSLK